MPHAMIRHQAHSVLQGIARGNHDHGAEVNLRPLNRLVWRGAVGSCPVSRRYPYDGQIERSTKPDR
jgi:hypothetical protein